MADALTIVRRSAIALQWRSAILVLLVSGLIVHAAATAQQRRGEVAIVAATELTHGSVIRGIDIRLARVALPGAGEHLLMDDPVAVVGKRVIGHIGRGEPITSTRVQARSAATHLTAMALVISEADAALVTIGDRVDVYVRRTSLDSQSASVVAREVEVINVTAGRGGFAESAASVVVLVDERAAAAVAAAKEGNRISIAVHGVDRSNL